MPTPADTESARIAAELADEIGGREPGDRLASEHELMNRFGASRSTIRRALEQLEARFLVRRVRGAGTFVNRRVDYLISSDGAPSLHRTVERAGSQARTFLIDSGTLVAPPEVAEAMGLPPGTSCTRLTRLGFIDDMPASVVEEWIVPGTVENLDVSLRAIESLSEVLRASGYTPSRAWSRASADVPPPEVLRRVEAPADAAMWRLETLTRDARSGEALMLSRSWLRQDRIRLVIEFAGFI